MKRYLVQLSTGQAGIARQPRPVPHPTRPETYVFVVRIPGRRLAVWPDYDVCEVPRLSWWLTRWLGG